MNGRIATAIALAGAIWGGGQPGDGRAAPVPGPAPPASTLNLEHRYRVYGRVRLALFWTRGSEVGTARMAVRGTPDGSELTFLLGSDPRDAPNGMNQWSYVREETRRDGAMVFGLRTLSADDIVDRRLPAMPDDAVFGASCAFVHDGGIRSLLTTVNGPGVTYRMFDRMLDTVSRAPQWQIRQLPRPAGVEVGLLSAMELEFRRSGGDPATLQALGPVTYIYDSTFYELSVRHAQPTGPTQIGRTRHASLTRVDFSILNRTTGVVTRFSAMFVPGRADALPVQLVFQPNFWVRVELRQDDTADAPPDPAADAATLERIRALCSGALSNLPQTATGRMPSPARN